MFPIKTISNSSAMNYTITIFMFIPPVASIYAQKLKGKNFPNGFERKQKKYKIFS